MKSTWRAAIAGSVIAALLIAGPPAQGAEAPPAAVAEARALYAEGLRLYRAGTYNEAIARLEASYRLVPAPGLLYDLAQAHRLKGDCAAARDLYRAYLDKRAEGEASELARSHLAAMTCPAAAPPPPAPASPPPAPPTAPNAEQPLLARTDVVPSGRRSGFFDRPAVVVLTATAAASALTAAVFAWRASDAADEVSASFRPGEEWTTAGMEAESRGTLSERIGIAAALSMIVSGGIAAWLATRGR